MDTLDQASALIAQIDAAGGPPIQHAARFALARRAVREAQSGGEDLGFVGGGLLIFGGITILLSFLGALAYTTHGVATQATKTVYWMGTAWVAWQLWKTR